MSAAFADTVFYVALLSDRDALHRPTMEFLAGFSGRIVTTVHLPDSLKKSIEAIASMEGYTVSQFLARPTLN